jgi:hypothetical protein
MEFEFFDEACLFYKKNLLKINFWSKKAFSQKLKTWRILFKAHFNTKLTVKKKQKQAPSLSELTKASP